MNHGFRRAQIGSTAAMAFSHGTQDAQKTMGVITLALVTTGHLSGFDVPPVGDPRRRRARWGSARSPAAGASSARSAAASRALDPPKAFASQTAASSVLLISAYAYKVPVSSTHIMTSSIMGVGATRRLSAVRWSVAQQVALAWVLTIPGAAISALRDLPRRQRDRRLSRRLRIP